MLIIKKDNRVSLQFSNNCMGNCNYIGYLYSNFISLPLSLTIYVSHIVTLLVHLTLNINLLHGLQRVI